MCPTAHETPTIDIALDKVNPELMITLSSELVIDSVFIFASFQKMKLQPVIPCRKLVLRFVMY